MTDMNAVFADAAKRASIERRFWKGLVKGPSCWVWGGAKSALGYGRMTAGRKTQLKTHRVSWMLHHGSLANEAAVLHRCDNPCCCNPDHLFLGTQMDNVIDMIQKNRNSAPPKTYGEKHHNTKFSEAAARAILCDTRAAETIAAEYGISAKTVYRLRHGLTWKKLA